MEGLEQIYNLYKQQKVSTAIICVFETHSWRLIIYFYINGILFIDLITISHMYACLCLCGGGEIVCVYYYVNIICDVATWRTDRDTLAMFRILIVKQSRFL
jgi:hypothetical protein